MPWPKRKPLHGLLLLGALLQLLLVERLAAAQSCPREAVRSSSTSQRIYVTGAGTVCTLTELDAFFSNTLLQKVRATSKIWMLRYNLYLEKGGTVVLHGDSAGGDVNELRLRSDSGGFVIIRADWGNLDIDGVKITSWNETAGAVDTNHSDGRAYLSVRSRLDADGVTARESRMDVRSSELAYLGYNTSEGYGLSWKVLGSTAGIFDKVNVLGDAIDNRFHHNYFGAYTYGGFGMQWIGNVFDQNVKYGFDPHDDSDELTVVDNDFSNNGNHGFICAERCDGLDIRDNRAWNNTGNGFMLYDRITDSVFEGNEAWGNTDAGLALYDSSDNVVRENWFHDNLRTGMRLSVGSSDNLIEDNLIEDNLQYGLYIFRSPNDIPVEGGDGRPRRNTFTHNTVSGNGRAVNLIQADDNVFVENVLGPSSGDEALVFSDGVNNMLTRNEVPSDDRIHVKTSAETASTLFITQAGGTSLQRAPLLVDVSGSGRAIFVETSGLSHQVTGVSTANLATPSKATLTMTSSSARLVLAHAIYARPASGTVRLTTTSPTTWKAQSTSGSLSTTFTVGGLTPDATYQVSKNGAPFQTVIASSGGIASFIDTVGITTLSYLIAPQ